MPPRTPHSQLLHCARVALFALALALPMLASADEPIGFVTEVRGSASATNTAGSQRALRANAPIRQGDRIATAAGGELGMLLGTYYAGLDQSTELLVVGLADNGAPNVKLAKGHVRLIDGDGKGGAVLDTPGLRIADVGAEAEGFAFGEKSWLVSMGCPNGISTAAERLKDGRPTGESLLAGPGDCIVSKPGEGLYAAKATHDPLGLLTGTPPPAAQGLAGDPSARFGGPLPPVALGLPGPRIATPPPTLLATSGPVGGGRLPCDVGAGGCQARPNAGVPLPNPPINPPVPGRPPGVP